MTKNVRKRSEGNVGDCWEKLEDSLQKEQQVICRSPERAKGMV